MSIQSKEEPGMVSLEEISPLPKRLDELGAKKSEVVGRYGKSVGELAEACGGGDQDRAYEASDKADRLEREADEAINQIGRTEAELRSLVTEKLSEARIRFKKIAGNGNRSLADHPLLRKAAESLATAGAQHQEDNLTAALLMGHHALSLLSHGTWQVLRNRAEHHSKRLSSF